MNTDIPLSRDDLEAQLVEQIGFLTASCEGYDSGNVAEAKRLALAIRILVHDAGTSRSLLSQLGLTGIGFYDTAPEMPEQNLLADSSLILLQMHGGEISYVPALDHGLLGCGRPVPFRRWWRKPIIRDKQQRVMTRADLVLAIANKDGGAHIDPALGEVYADLSRNNSLGWRTSDGEKDRPIEGGHLATVRQIAHELLHSLQARTSPALDAESLAGVGRNAPCPCGSGRKFKKCHGIGGAGDVG